MSRLYQSAPQASELTLHRPLKAIVARLAVQTEVSPMAALMEWIVSLSHFVFNTALLDIVSWPSPRAMWLKDLEINIDQFFLRVKSSFQELCIHVCERYCLPS